MTQQAAAILRRARERTAGARELLAADLLEWEKVTAAIGAAAARGLDQVEFTGSPGVRFAGTEVGKALAAKLQGGGFSVDWIERPPLRPGEAVTFVLVVAW